MLEQIKTESGMQIEYEQQSILYQNAIEPLLEKLNSQRGALFTSSFEFPGRYTCWDIGFYNPPLALTCMDGCVQIQALNERGHVLLAMIQPVLKNTTDLEVMNRSDTDMLVRPIQKHSVFSEEERSRQPSVFNVLRHLLAFFKTNSETYLGFYGAFGYDLIFQFESVTRSQHRTDNQRDMVLYLPDEIFVVNHRKEEAFVRRYDFHYQGKTTQGLTRQGEHVVYSPKNRPSQGGDHQEGEYARIVKEAKNRFACGDLFEVVPSQTFFRYCPDNPSVIFSRMREKNPSPYGFFINLGKEEYLVGASPEMYVRVQGRRVESCPISGTIKRGQDAIEDAHNIQLLLDSEKECSELTMCTDVDRNDKSRICEAGSVRVIGRRQIEMYSRLIHTVDHIEGQLRPEFDALDAFLTHMWVVTVTGAPKLWAMNFIEEHEKSPRQWYGGAVGWLNFNGNMNTGLVLRTMHICQGIAAIRVGATLLYDSDPQAEEAETRLKASAFLELLNQDASNSPPVLRLPKNGVGKKVLLIDHQDSFVHTLGNYLRQTGAEVTTVRHEYALTFLQQQHHDLVVFSPGPGKPDDFNLSEAIQATIEKDIPIFGVCLGLQGIIQHFGGELHILDYPMHGKPSTVNIIRQSSLFSGFGASFTAGRYHSIYALKDEIPDELEVTALSDGNIVMAISHQTLPIHAVQFHPETILSTPGQAGLKIISNLMEMV